MSYDESKHRLSGFRPLTGTMSKLTKPMLGKVGRVQGMLWMHWLDAVGKDIAAYTQPGNLTEDKHAKRMVLHVQVLAERAQVLEYQQHEMIDKIAMFFGYRAVSAIVLHQVTEFSDDT